MRWRIAKKVFAGCLARAHMDTETRKQSTVFRAIERWFKRRRLEKP